jgi:hypothetical protein
MTASRRLLMAAAALAGGGSVGCSGSGGVDAYTTLMVHSDTSDGSTTFTDSSESAHTITANGNVHHEVDQQKWGATSVYFDGTGDYIQTTDVSDLRFGGDFTIDCWVRLAATGTTRFVLGKGNTQTNQAEEDFHIQILSTGYMRCVLYYGASNTQFNTSSNPITDTNWHHIAMVKSGTVITAYVDGVASGTGASTLPSNGTSYPLSIGRNGNTSVDTWGYHWYGYIDEVRISNGIARWRENFTPPTEAYTNTISKWEPGVDGDTTLLIKSNTTDGSTTFTDSSPEGHTITEAGNTHHETDQQKFGTTSIYFDGTGDALEVDDGVGFTFGSGDWTIDFWLYKTDTSDGVLLDKYHSVSNQRWIQLTFTSSDNSFRVQLSTAGTSWSQTVTSTANISTNTWTHIALVRGSSDSLRLYIDGALDSAFAATTQAAMHDSTQSISLGSFNLGASDEYTGYLDEFRVSKHARWEGEFTPPTYEYCTTFDTYWPGNDGFTKLLIHSDTTDGSTTFTDSSLSGHTLTAVGDAQHDTAEQVFGATSMLFDGTGDYIYAADHADWDLLSSTTTDYTIDFWIQFNATPRVVDCIIGQYTSGTSYWYIYHHPPTNGFSLQFNNGSSYTHNFGGAITEDSTFHHIALVKKGSSLKLYVDGTLAGSDTQTSTISVSAPLDIGWGNDSTNTFPGWLDEVRFSKGIARWQSDFTPPTLTYDDEK